MKRPQDKRKDPIDLPPLEPSERKPKVGAPITVTILMLFGVAAVGFLVFDLRFGDIGDVWLLLPLTGVLFYAVFKVMNR